MYRKFPILSLLGLGITALITCQTVWAEDNKPIARVLDPVSGYDEYTFKSFGGEILFAEIRSDIYQTRGRKGGSHEGTEGADGGCSDGGSTGGCSDGGSTGGCSDGGSTGGCTDGGGGSGVGDLCLQVLDPDGQKICWAGRPARPGWQRDPRLACPIPEGYGEREFTLRVFQGQCGNPDMTAVAPPGQTPVVYLLYFQLLSATK